MRERANRGEVACAKTMLDRERGQRGDRILTVIQHDDEGPQSLVVMQQRTFHLRG